MEEVKAKDESLFAHTLACFAATCLWGDTAFRFSPSWKSGMVLLPLVYYFENQQPSPILMIF